MGTGARFLLSRRWVLFFATVVVLAYLAFRLGEWQFDRLEQRRVQNEVVARNADAEPVPVGTVLGVGEPVAPDEEWRRVTATGEYVDEETVVVRYQTRDGAAGVDLVTPLLTEEGTAVLVDRGWLATDNVGTTRLDLPASPAGEVTVVGWVRADAEGSAAAVADRSTRAVSSAEIGPTVPFPVYTGFLDLESETPPADEPLALTEPPDLSEGPHFFYGLQWWFFGALAVFGFGYLAWDERRRMRRGARPPGAPGAGHATPPEPEQAPRTVRS